MLRNFFVHLPRYLSDQVHAIYITNIYESNCLIGNLVLNGDYQLKVKTFSSFQIDM